MTTGHIFKVTVIGRVFPIVHYVELAPVPLEYAWMNTLKTCEKVDDPLYMKSTTNLFTEYSLTGT